MYELLERLYNLGFEYIPNLIAQGHTSHNDFMGYFDDIERARKLCTEEEFSTNEYKEALNILAQLYRGE